MEVVSMNRLDYNVLKFHEYQIEKLRNLAEQLENGEIDSVEFGEKVLNVL